MKLVEDLFGILPIEADARGPRGDLLRFHQRGQGARDGGKQPGGGGSLLRLFRGFGFTPDAQDVVRRIRGPFAEDVRMAANQLGVDGVEGVPDGE